MRDDPAGQPLPPAQAPEPCDKEAYLRALAARLVHTIGVARGLVKGGRTVNLAGMEDGVGLLCAQTLDLPSARGRDFLPQLTEVLAEVESLSRALQESASDAGSGSAC